MTCARGRSSRTLIDRDFPYQVLVLAESVGGEMLDKVDAFHTERALPTKKRSVRRDESLWSLFCFAQRVDAATFRHLFGGKLFSVCRQVEATPYRSGPSRTWIKVKNPNAPAATRTLDGTF